MGSLLEEAIREYFGERCPDFEPGCPCCRAWAEFDSVERLRAALHGICLFQGLDDDGRTMQDIARAALEEDRT